MNTDRYNHWLRQDMPRLLITAVIVALVVWVLWAAHARWRIFDWIVPPAPVQVAPVQLPDTTVVPSESPDSDQTLEGE